MIETKKEDFIDDYIQAAMESPHESRDPHQIQTDADVEWEADQIDLAYERYLQEQANG